MAERYPTFNRMVDWAAIVAGFVVAFVIGILLSLIVAMIGGPAINPYVAAAISFFSVLCGGWFAGFLAPTNGLLHGTLVGVLSVIVTSLLAAIFAGTALSLAFPGLPSATVGAAALLIGFIIQLIAGAIGGYIADITTTGQPVVRT